MSTEGTRLYPRTSGVIARRVLNRHGDERAAIVLNNDDLDTYRASYAGVTITSAPGEWVPVTDMLTGHAIKVRAAACGLRCVCDMEVSA